jgi:ankyrin repeat protein
MIIKFSEYISEGIRDKMTPMSSDEMKSKIIKNSESYTKSYDNIRNFGSMFSADVKDLFTDEDKLTIWNKLTEKDQEKIFDVSVGYNSHLESIGDAAYKSISYPRDEIVSFLRRIGYKPIDKTKLAWHLGNAASKNLGLINTLISFGADVNAKDYWGKSCLVSSIEKNRKDIIKILLDNGADIHAYDDSAIKSAMKNNPNILKVLNNDKNL